MKKLLSIILTIVLATALFSGCKKDKGDPPALPPLKSMTIDFSNFLTSKKSAGLLSYEKGTESSNWEFAATVAEFWSPIINSTLKVPVTSYGLAIDQDPGYLEENTWQWNYNVSVDGNPYKVRLTGQISAANVIWKMYISGSFEEFLWVEGTSKTDGTSGQWILDEGNQAQTAYLRIDWVKSSSSINNVTYIYLKDDSFNGSSIKYILTSTTSASYDDHHYNGVKFSDIDIEWNPAIRSGRVKSADYLLGDWYCWNEQTINSVCE